MTCAACSDALEKALSSAAGVQMASVSLALQQAEVHATDKAASEVGLSFPVAHYCNACKCVRLSSFDGEVAASVTTWQDCATSMKVVHHCVRLAGLWQQQACLSSLQAVLLEVIETAGFTGRLISSTESTADRTVAMRVNGMTCGSCSAAVEKALQAHTGVMSASVNLLAGTAEVRPDVAGTPPYCRRRPHLLSPPVCSSCSGRMRAHT